MNSTARFLVWFSTQTQIIRCLTAALLLHLALLILLGTIRLVTAVQAKPVISNFLPAPPETPPATPEPGDGDGSQEPGTTLASFTPTIPTTTFTGPSPRIGIDDPVGTLPANDNGTWSRPSVDIPTCRPGISYVQPAGNRNSPYHCRLLPKLIPTGTRTTTGPTQATETSVLAALRWLRDHQERNGSWKCSRSPHGSTGLALLAFLAHGETPDSPEFGDTVGRGLGFLVNTLDTGGFVPGKNMYAQAIVALALCEGYALTTAPALREPAERAVRILLTAQNAAKSNPLHDGGWRYTPASMDADTSVTGWSIMALEAASHAGLNVPTNSLRRAGDYLWRMRGKAGFGYAGPGDTPGMTAVATFCLQFLGHSEDHRLKSALDLLKQQKVSWAEARGSFVLYGWYYTTLAMFQGGGAYWESWNQQIAKSMLAAQSDDGSCVRQVQQLS